MIIQPDKPKVKRPWGGYSIIKKTNHLWVKKLYINKGLRLSLQNHQFRDEVWVVAKGIIQIQIGRKVYIAKKGDIAVVPRKKKHRMTGLTNACIIEIAYGKTLERDIKRYEDDFGRA